MPSTSSSRALALIVAGAFFMEFLDGTVIATALPRMAASFDVPAVDLGIGMSAYLLTLAAFLPASGFLAERFGSRTIFCTAIGVFTAASIACAFSTGLWSFTLARVLQGAGGSMMVPVGRLVVLRATPKPQLMRAIATLTWPALAAPIIAPPLGGLIATYASWRWIFFINVPIGIVGALLAWRIVPDQRGGAARPFDGIGFALTGLCGLAFMGGTELLGRESIDGLGVGAALAASLVLGACAVAHGRRHPAPIPDLSGLAIPSFAASALGGSLFRIAVSTLPFLLPLMFQLSFGLDAFRSGLLVLAVFLGNVAMKPLTTPILRRLGFRATMVGNGLLTAISIALCAAIGPGTPIALTAAILFLGGMFRSMGLTAINTIAFADVPETRMTGANTLFNMLQQMSLGMGVAIGALALRVAAVWRPDGATGVTTGEFHVAFVLVSLVALAAVLDAAMLPRDAGAQVTRG